MDVDVKEGHYALKVGMRWCTEEWLRGPCVSRLSGDEALVNFNIVS